METFTVNDRNENEEWGDKSIDGKKLRREWIAPRRA